jgi:dihydroorotase
MACFSARTARKTLAQSKKRAEPTSYSNDQSLLVKDAKIWTRAGFLRGSILVERGKISRVARRLLTDADQTIDASGLCALPGLVDVHVHLRDMGLAYKEDFATGTAAAAAGGFTTVFDMPNTIPPTSTPRRLIEKQWAAKEKIYVNVGFHAAASPDPKTIAGLARAGAFSLKLYMPEPITPLDIQDDEAIRGLMHSAYRFGMPVTVHAEDTSVAAQAPPTDSFEALAEAREPSLEIRAVRRIRRIQEMTRCRVHYCHLTLDSSLGVLNSLSPGQTAEVTPHHLLLSKKALRNFKGKGWMVPPLRSNRERLKLLLATRQGKADVLASDHAPHTLREKAQPPGKCPPGVPGLETTLPLMLTLVNKGFFSMSRIVKLLAENPSRIFRLESRAAIQRGNYADVTIVDLKKRGRIDSGNFFSKAKYSPFDGYRTMGAVESTIVGGTLVYRQGEIVADRGCGAVLRRRAAN